MIYGYKGLKKGNMTHFGDVLEEGVTYSVEGPLKVGLRNGEEGNGYHMCEYLSDVFRFFPNEKPIIAFVEGSDENIEYSDDYYGNLGMHVCRSIKILKILSREEVIDTILDSGEMNIVNYLRTDKLNEEETDKFLDCCRSYPIILEEILYSQKGYKDIFRNRIQAKDLIDKQIKRIDEQKGKAKVIVK